VTFEDHFSYIKNIAHIGLMYVFNYNGQGSVVSNYTVRLMLSTTC